ncbi:MAG: glycosyltransferase family 1 protein [Opitutaceae bacterium]
MIGGPFRLIARMALAQAAPMTELGQKWMVFSSHHAPLWTTGRHIVIVYDLIALRFGEQARMQNAFYRHLLPRVLRSATRIVTISGAVRDELKTVFPFLADRLIDVIPAWSESLEVKECISAPVLSRKSHVLVVGARYPHKNLSLVLDAMSQFSRTGSGQRLVVAGIRKELWNQRASWRILEEQGLLTALDFPTDSEMDELYRKAHCLVYPSLAEGQGLPPLEALKRGCPVVCSDIPVLKETCGQASFFVDPHDSRALAGLLSEICTGQRKVEIEEMTCQAPEVLKRFSNGVLTRKWRALLDSLP